MVCVSCVVIPFVLWFFNKFVRPYVAKFLPWFKESPGTTDPPKTNEEKEVMTNGTCKFASLLSKGEPNGHAFPNGHAPISEVGGGSKKDN